MENLTNLIANNGLMKPSNPSNEPPQFENASHSEIESYQDRLYLIVDASFNLSNQMPTDTEKAARVDAWARALMGIVPERDLQRSFDHAFRTHTSNFPVSAYDLKDAYFALIEMERGENQVRRQLEEESRRKTTDVQCSFCFDTGFQTKIIDGYSAAVKCGC